ncbi:hypothetical protein BYT27DRAFT_7208568 [Phlegmacium glaucopus]|nr:hypothetical protein BYT27DRAFT_7208568 [Phlegmacium glaucopus]
MNNVWERCPQNGYAIEEGDSPKPEDVSPTPMSNVSVDIDLVRVVDCMIQTIKQEWPTQYNNKNLRIQYIFICSTPTAFSAMFKMILERKINVATNTSGPHCELKEFVECQTKLDSDSIPFQLAIIQWFQSLSCRDSSDEIKICRSKGSEIAKELKNMRNY